MSVKYYISDLDTYYDTPEEAVDACIDEAWHEDDCYDIESWINEKYTAYEVFSNNLLYSDLVCDFCEEKNDEDRDEALYELEDAENGYVVSVHGTDITVIVEEDEEEDPEESFIDPVDECRMKIEEARLDILKAKEEERKEDNVYLCIFQEMSS